MSRPHLPPHINDLLALYFDNRATPEVCREIEDWLAQDPAHIKIIAEFGYIERMMYSAQKTQDASAIFAVLAEMEDAAEGEVVELKLEAPTTPHANKNTDTPPITAGQVASVAGYVLQQALTRKPAIIAYAAAAAAAIALLATVLLIPWQTGPADPQTAAQAPPNQPTAPIEPITPAVAAVATLTATHNARWAGLASAAPAVGDALHPGQRLTLTAGFAEITTARGAVAILEAPASIELTDRDNALRLHTGKLVGICETDASKGFVVRTLHMDVTDLGTRFGVEVSARGTAEVHVLTGSVTVQRPEKAGDDPRPRHLYAGQAVRAEAGSDQWLTVPSHLERFAFPHEDVVPLPGTGFGLQQGKPDPNWQIVAYEGQALSTPLVPVVAPQDLGRDGLPNRPDTSQWLHWVKTQPTADLSETYLFQTRIQLPDQMDPATARIVLQCASDNQLVALVVNGTRIPIRTEQETFLRHTHEITQGLVAGENTIGFEVLNVWSEGRTSQEGNAVGLRVEWEFREPAR